MKILILGASGQIGYPLFLHLSQVYPQGTIVGTSRSGKRKETVATAASSFPLTAFDPFAENDWTRLGTFDLVYNCVGQIRASKEMSFERIHLGLTERLLARRAQLGHPRLVQLSALGAGNYPDIPFLATKAAADVRLLAAPDTAVIRPSIVWTPNTMLLRKLRQLNQMRKWLFGRVIVPRGFLQSRVQPIEIEALTALMQRVGEGDVKTRIVPAVGAQPVSFGALLEEVAGKPVAAWEIPRKFIEPLVQYVIAPFFPSLINYDQFRLLFEDNIAESVQ